MRSILNFFRRYSNVLIFLILEVIAFYLLFNGPSYHNIRISNGLNSIEGTAQKYISGATDYFSIRQINEELVRENLELKNRLEKITPDADVTFFEVYDSIYLQQYFYTSARVVNQTVNRQKNFITINKGSEQGIEPGMAVSGPDGVVGVIVGSSNNFSVAMSLINLDFRLSARFRKNGYYGSLGWNGNNQGIATLQEIPHHVELFEGDTVETSGYSSVFPEGIMIGTVQSVDRQAGDFLNISVKLSTDFKKLHNIYIIGNLRRGEQLDTEDKFINNNMERND